MKSENQKFGQMLFKLNRKVNRRSSYIHNMSLKYHSGLFSHNIVLSNIKHEACLQVPRSYIQVESRSRDSMHSSTSQSHHRGEDTSFSLPLRTSLVKFYIKPNPKSPKSPRHTSQFSKRITYIAKPKYNYDEEIGTETGLI